MEFNEAMERAKQLAKERPAAPSPFARLRCAVRRKDWEAVQREVEAWKAELLGEAE
jgi:hypothetical protein